MKLTDASAEQIRLIEDLLKKTKELWQKIRDLETSQDNCQGIMDAQNAVISQYRMAFKHLSYGIYIKNADMKYLYCNEVYAQFLNMRTIDILGRTDAEILSQESAEKYSASEKRVWYLGQAVEEEENHFINGDERTFHVVRRLIKGEKHDLASLLGILIDITEMKHREEQSKQLSLEQSRQIESLISEVEQAHKFTKQQEEECKMLRASLEMQIALRDTELERLLNELQQQTAERKKAAHVLLTKVSDLQNFVASSQKYLDL